MDGLGFVLVLIIVSSPAVRRMVNPPGFDDEDRSGYGNRPSHNETRLQGMQGVCHDGSETREGLNGGSSGPGPYLRAADRRNDRRFGNSSVLDADSRSARGWMAPAVRALEPVNSQRRFR
ncbi:hypothetical protein B7486_16080 [cyanobacterium TDX16]|nr:hypothetical protein B7486_16080 [cyanobacterium TDX16]